MSATLLFLLALAPVADPADKPATPETRAQAFVAALEKGKFADTVADFDDAMRKALPADKLESLWKTVVAQVGALEKQVSARTEKAGPFIIVYVTCKFAKMALDVKVVFDKQQKITGLGFVPVQNKDSYPPPPYARPDAFGETQVKVGTGEWQLPGTLTMPKGGGPFPGVVLVHGSGPQDRDETIGRSKVFRDLAWGLATKGIAVLRYEKRTREHGVKLIGLKTFTVNEETVDDAMLAAELLRKTPGIDPKRVFIVGHSQGAMMAPRMALADKALAGIVLLAAPSRPLEDVILDQTTRGLAQRAKLSENEVKLLEALDGIARLVKDGKLTAETPPEKLLGQAAAYWQSICGFSSTADALKLELPILILQGEADDQVTMADFAGWQKAMKDRKNATLKSYPKLGHPFTPTDGAPETRSPHVAPEVVADIAAWILARR